jgi:hypothetical protein
MMKLFQSKISMKVDREKEANVVDRKIIAGVFVSSHRIIRKHHSTEHGASYAELRRCNERGRGIGRRRRRLTRGLL